MIPDDATPAQDPVLTSALTLCQAGYAVHWLRPRSKAPVSAQWSTASVHTAASLHRSYRPGQNVGVRCGIWSHPTPETGLVVLDVDIKDAACVNEALDALRAFNLPTTRTVMSGSGNGSSHQWYACPYDQVPTVADTVLAHGAPLRATSKKYTWSLALLSTGKNLVVPPSIHPDTGAQYTWVDAAAAIALLPPSLLDAYQRVRAAQTPTRTAHAAGTKIPEGGRDEYLFKRACALRGQGWSAAAIAAALLVENQEMCDPPLPEAIVREKAQSAAKYPPEAAKPGRGGRSKDARPPDPLPAATPVPPDDALGWLQKRFKTPLLGMLDVVRVENTDPLGVGHLVLILGDGTRVKLGSAEQVLAPKRAQAAIAAATTAVLPDMTRAVWLTYARALFKAAVPVDVGAHEEAETRGWLVEWLHNTSAPTPVDPQDATQLATYVRSLVQDWRSHGAAGGQPIRTSGYFWTTTGRFVLAPTTLLKYAKTHFNPQLRLSGLRQRLYDLEIRRADELVEGMAARAHVWASAEGYMIERRTVTSGG